MSSNRLCLNCSKTQFIWLGGRLQLPKIDLTSLSQLFPDISFSYTVRDLGVVLDQELTMSAHINNLSRSCFYHLRQLRAIRHSLPNHAIRTLIQALICTRLDFGNAVFAGLSVANLSKLQSVLNSAFLNSVIFLPLLEILCTGFLWPSASNSRSSPLCETVLLVLLLNISLISVSRFRRSRVAVPCARSRMTFSLSHVCDRPHPRLAASPMLDLQPGTFSLMS